MPISAFFDVMIITPKPIMNNEKKGSNGQYGNQSSNSADQEGDNKKLDTGTLQLSPE